MVKSQAGEKGSGRLSRALKRVMFDIPREVCGAADDNRDDDDLSPDEICSSMVVWLIYRLVTPMFLIEVDGSDCHKHGFFQMRWIS